MEEYLARLSSYQICSFIATKFAWLPIAFYVNVSPGKIMC